MITDPSEFPRIKNLQNMYQNSFKAFSSFPQTLSVRFRTTCIQIRTDLPRLGELHRDKYSFCCPSSDPSTEQNTWRSGKDCRQVHPQGKMIHRHQHRQESENNKNRRENSCMQQFPALGNESYDISACQSKQTFSENTED